MVEHTLENKDPIKQMHVLWAIKWAIAAWKEVTPQTIKNYFIKSTLFGLRENPQPRPCNYINPPILNELEQITEQLHTAGRVRNVTNIHNFIELPGKEVKDSTEDLIKYVAELYVGPDRDTETDEDESKQPQIKLNEALQALQKLRLYKE